jgi:hypothetical protein
MIRLQIQTAAVRRLLSPGQTRVVIRAVDEQDRPTAIFLCCVEPPNSLEQRLRESFHTVCSVEDMTEYPVGVSCVREIDPKTADEGVFLYCVQENIVYVRARSGGKAVWIPYKPKPENLKPNVHTHTFPFFRRSTIDIILPNRDFVVQAIGWIEEAVKQLEQDFCNLEQLKRYDE